MIQCSACQATTQEGKYCSQCGASLLPLVCDVCGEAHLPGTIYCTQCGVLIREPVWGSPGGIDNQTQRTIIWSVAGLGLTALILFLAWPVYGPEGRSSSERAPSPLATGVSSVDLSSMTPREAADRLFNRVMTAVEQNDSTEVVRFLPMAMSAYELAEPLDLDGKFHLAVLRMQGTLAQEGLSAAEEILATYPNHLLGLGVAADALVALGDTAGAREYYQRWLEVYDDEVARDLPEYRNHERMFPDMELRARELVN